MKKKINIEGMSCGHCVAHVKEALEEISGVEILEVNLEGKNALVNTEVEDNTLIAAIDEAGYDVISIDKL
ncbi:heavy-metal-associated domain-containing protein [Clostridium tertium]|uniref:heavy-metal-associated domain-containing protein n=1 Tax=Clostridium tertium TaxID=1559 RepID=UPI001AE26C13|nr:heavy-metal-associated domain-containing protein [Clostridium tertium]MBP1867137.1 copper chaperone [Clostridium tertium]